MSSSGALVIVAAAIVLCALLLAACAGAKTSTVAVVPGDGSMVDKALRHVLGDYRKVDDGYVGSRDGFRVVIPSDLRRISYEMRITNSDAVSSNVRFDDQGNVRRGDTAVASMPVEAQQAVRQLGKLGASEIDSYGTSTHTVQMPYGQSEDEFADSMPRIAEQADVIARGIGEPSGR